MWEQNQIVDLGKSRRASREKRICPLDRWAAKYSLSHRVISTWRDMTRCYLYGVTLLFVTLSIARYSRIFSPPARIMEKREKVKIRLEIRESRRRWHERDEWNHREELWYYKKTVDFLLIHDILLAVNVTLRADNYWGLAGVHKFTMRL